MSLYCLLAPDAVSYNRLSTPVGLTRGRLGNRHQLSQIRSFFGVDHESKTGRIIGHIRRSSSRSG